MKERPFSEESFFKKVMKKTIPLIVAGGITFGALDKNDNKTEKTKIVNIEEYKEELEKVYEEKSVLEKELEESLQNNHEDPEEAIKFLKNVLDQSREKYYQKQFANQDFFANKYFEKVLTDENRREKLLMTVMDAAKKYGVPYEIAMGMLAVESGGDSETKSKKEAVGIFQIIPATAEQYGMKVDKNNLEKDDRSDDNKNAETAMHVLSDYYKMFGQWPLALIAYNAGPGKLKGLMNTLYDLKDKSRVITEADQADYKELKKEGKLDLVNFYKKIMKSGIKTEELPGLNYALDVFNSAPEMQNILNLNLDKKVAFQQEPIKRPDFF